MSFARLTEAMQAAAWTGPQRRFLEQLIAYVLPGTLLPGTGIAIDQDSSTGTLTFSAESEARTLVFQYDISGDETTVVTTGAAKRTWRMPIPFTVEGFSASLTTASSSGVVEIDVLVDGTTLFGANKLTIDEGEEWSGDAATAADLGAQTIDAGAEITFNVDDDGTNAVGLKVYLVGTYAIDPDFLITEASEFYLTEDGDNFVTG